ncbi:hypothetical protein GOP47_0010290 [Adiantum capillus-veneris]|uniref:Cyanobacterial aminoacyl-tRNA synthetase CAAD domain-containing protein n=1 Tax=Adiantum capillus-veneris TaxID=13818 RepID=A0A9D4UUG3_ADICA|nr:hypothetical protein GOP47_0010290 [Adiantum capillus-veneris]
MVVSSLSHCFSGALVIDKKGSSLGSHGSFRERGSILCASFKDEFQAVKQSSTIPSELSLPLASQLPSSTAAADPNASSGKDNKPASQVDMEASEKDTELLSKALQRLGKTTGVQLAIYGGLIAGGLYLVESLLNSFEVLPLLPETLQLVGVVYAILFGSRLFQGKPVSLMPSPVKAITELVDRKGTLVQKTNLKLPQDLDIRVVAKMEQLSRERDDAVNKLEALRRKVADYARIEAEKEALEAVAVQLAQERDEAMSEVVALKQAVDAMSGRMQIVENALQKELEPLKQSSEALETVALQLASERDSALKELSELKEELTLAKSKEEENNALESLASQLARERDQANLENEQLKEMSKSLPVADIQELVGSSPDQKLFLKKHIEAAGLQFIDPLKPYDDQKEEVEKFVSHLVEEYNAPSEWTLDYLKQILEDSSSKAQELSSSSSYQESGSSTQQ